MPRATNTQDHDLLIRIDTKLDELTKQFVEFRKDTAADLDRKADKTALEEAKDEIHKLSGRIKATEKFMWKALGIVGFIEVMAAVAIAIHYLRQ